MIAPCMMVVKDGVDGWCEWHGMYHSGMLFHYATGTDPISIRWREIWDNVRSQISDGTVPDVNPHIPDYDDCPHRGEMLEGAKCSYKSFACSIYGKCSTQRGHSVKICQDCKSYPFPKGTIIERGRKLFRYMSKGQGDGVVMSGGGNYEASLYVAKQMVRLFDPNINITIFHGVDEPIIKPDAFHDVTMKLVPATVPIGWQMKGYAMLHSPYTRTIYLDSDFYPTQSVRNYFNAASGVLCANGLFECIQWDKYGLTPDGRPPLDGGFFMIDRIRHPELVWLYYYLSTLCHAQTYQWGCGDQDQLRAALRGLEIEYDTIGQGVHNGSAVVYDAGVHRYADKYRGRSQQVYNTYTRRPTPQGNLPYETEAFRFFYEFMNMTEHRQSDPV